MHLGKILGTVVCSQKDPSLLGVKLLLMQPLDDQLNPVGGTIVTADPVGARHGDTVMWVASREASLALDNKFAPVDAAVVGLVDRMGDRSFEL
ncbi:MAG: EutN/CcmL family microcompartment protein [Oligoflexia bacterium]|nr:EutN/CcmL family microcompartment protein [Oligoflexia bacterium]